MAKLQAKWLIVSHAVFPALYLHIDADLSRELMYDGQKLLLIVVIFKAESNFNFCVNKYEDAVNHFDSLSDRLTWSVTD